MDVPFAHIPKFEDMEDVAIIATLKEAGMWSGELPWLMAAAGSDILYLADHADDTTATFELVEEHDLFKLVYLLMSPNQPGLTSTVYYTVKNAVHDYCAKTYKSLMKNKLHVNAAFFLRMAVLVRGIVELKRASIVTAIVKYLEDSNADDAMPDSMFVDGGASESSDEDSSMTEASGDEDVAMEVRGLRAGFNPVSAGVCTQLSDSHYVNTHIVDEVMRLVFFWVVMHMAVPRGTILYWPTIRSIIRGATSIVSINNDVSSGMLNMDRSMLKKLGRDVSVTHTMNQDHVASTFVFRHDYIVYTRSPSPEMHIKLFKVIDMLCTSDTLETVIDDVLYEYDPKHYGATIEDLDAVVGDEFAALMMSLEI